MVKRKKDTFIEVRSVLGNQVFKNKRTRRCYLIKWSKNGTPKPILLKDKKGKIMKC